MLAKPESQQIPLSSPFVIDAPRESQYAPRPKVHGPGGVRVSTILEPEADRARATTARPAALLVVTTHCGDTRWSAEKMEVIQEEYKHDIAVITLIDRRGHAERVHAQQPAKVSWGYTDGRLQDLFGYVSSVEWVEYGKLPPGQRAVQIVVVGASARMKQSTPKVWPKGTRLKSVFTWNARQHYMRAFAGGEVFRKLLSYELIQSPNESTWEVLVKMAKRYDYILYAKNTQLWIYRREVTPQHIGLRPPVFLEDDVFKFEPYDPPDLKNDPLAKTTTSWALNPKSGSIEKIVVKPAVYPSGNPCWPAVQPETSTIVMAPNDDEPRKVLESGLTRSQWGIRARVHLRGDVRAQQGLSLYMPTMGRTFPAGPWYMPKVTHILTKDNYILKAEIARVGNRNSRKPVTPKPGRVGEDPAGWSPPTFDPGTEPRRGRDPILVWPLPPSRPGDDLPDDTAFPDDGLLVPPAPPRLPPVSATGPTCPLQPAALLPAEWRDPEAGLRNFEEVA